MLNITIDGKRVEAEAGRTILDVALGIGVYIPHLCAHSDLPPFDKSITSNVIYRGTTPINSTNSAVKWEGCNLCVVEVQGVLRTSCNTIIEDGMIIQTNTPKVKEARQSALTNILATHPHACLTCAQKEGCSLTQCSTNVPQNERCCPKFGKCELQKVAEYIGIPANTPKYTYKNLSTITTDPLFRRDFNLCISCLRCVRMCNDIRGIGALGFVYSIDNKPVVGTVMPGLKESGCKFCGSCAEVCPTGAIMDKEDNNKREVPCIHNCPIGIDVPRYINYITEHKFADALSVINEKTPFPGILGSLCEHPCETNCRRGEVNETISICALKRFVVENQKARCHNQEFKEQTGKRVAIVGAGPCGLTAAYYLSYLGHSVTIFDSLPEPGGMLLSAIPQYRLPMKMMKEEIDAVLKVGIEFRGNTTLGKNITIDELLKRGYDAMFLATGAGISKKVNIEGLDANGVLYGIEFLRAINSEIGGQKSEVRNWNSLWSQGKPNKVIVVGGGNVAIDAALSALRLGAKEVFVYCLESRDEMPAYKWEINQAIEEGIVINCGWGHKRILQTEKKVVGVEFIKCISVFDDTHKFNPLYDESVTTRVTADMVIMAIGQEQGLSFLPVGMKINSESLETSIQGVFAGGDMIRGPSSVVKAIADGRRAASLIDKYLGGSSDGNLGEPSKEPSNPYLGKEEGFADKVRVKMPCLPVNKRIGNFNQVELGLGETQAIEEAKRCLRCDLRFDIHSVALPPEAWVEFKSENINNVPPVEGVFQLLTEDKSIIYIKGTINLKQELEGELGRKSDVRYFMYEEEQMFTKRESELLQRFLQVHSKLPKYNAELDDLF